MFVIFSIDSVDRPDSIDAFYLHTKDAPGEVICRDGSYKGSAETCFFTTKETFEEYVRGSTFIAEQESVLWVDPVNLEACLEYLADGRTAPVGRMNKVNKEEAIQYNSWHHDPVTGRYWTTEKSLGF